jgi:hypothetical protein
MRVAALVVVAAIGVLLGSGVADAEKVRTNQSTNVLARPGEQAKVLLTVKSGQNMTLLNQEGRWLKVRVQGRTGFVPRSKVDMADSGGIARNTRRRPFVDGRGKRRGFGGDSAPDDRVGADALGDTGSSGGDDEADDEEEEDAPKPKKAVAKVPPAKVVASKGKPADDDEEEDDEEEDAPPPKKTAAKAPPVKTPAKAPPPKVAVATKATSSKAKDEDEEEDDEDDADKGKGKGSDDEEEEDEDTKPAAKKAGGDDEDPIGDKKGGDDEADERPVAHVRKQISAYEDADAESEEQFVARPTDVLYPMENKGGWTFVENAEGDAGWVMSDSLELEGSGGGGGSTGRRVIDIRARAGITVIQQGMRTAGSNVLEVPDNYNIGTRSMTVSIGTGILIPKGKWLLGGEFTYDYAKAMGGGVPYDPDGPDAPMPAVNIGITLHNVNVRALAGIDLKKKSGMTLFGRLGYRYQGFLITDVANFTANPARLPSEVVKAPTLGAALAIPRLTEKIGIKFSLDAILFAASVKQTVGLEDGGAPSVKAIVLGTDFTYKITKSFDLMATYNLNYMSIDFGAPVMTSVRNHMGTNVKRADIFHMITFGISKPF